MKEPTTEKVSSAGNSVSVVIPTLNAATYLPDLLASLHAQRPRAPAEILVIDSESTDRTAACASAAGAAVCVIKRASFSHGRARNMGVRIALGDIVVFMSQDATPNDTAWLANLTAPFADGDVGAAFSRQVPRPDANPMERHFLDTHFPPGAKRVMRLNGSIDLLFQEDVFFSNVSSAVRRDLALCHPFDESLVMSEDQQLARDLLLAGHSVVYAPESVVVHSHDYCFRRALRRYFDSAYSLTQVFPKHTVRHSVRIGARYVAAESLIMVRRHPTWLWRYLLLLLAKAAGTILGHFAERLPRTWIDRLSFHGSLVARRSGPPGANKGTGPA